MKTIDITPDWVRLREIEAQHGPACECGSCRLVKAARADVQRQITELVHKSLNEGRAQSQAEADAITRARAEWGIS